MYKYILKTEIKEKKNKQERVNIFVYIIQVLTYIIYIIILMYIFRKNEEIQTTVNCSGNTCS